MASPEERLGNARTSLEIAAARLRELGFEVLPHNRIVQHLRILEDALSDEFDWEDPERRKHLAHAMRDSTELSLMSAILPDSASAGFLEEVRRAIAGAAKPLGSDSPESRQFQSQLWVGGVFAASGYRLQAGGSGADFRFMDGNLFHGIEIKRPQSEGKLKRAAEKAQEQLRKSSAGGILWLDVSDIMFGVELLLDDRDSEFEQGGDRHSRFNSLSERFDRSLRESDGRAKPKFSHIWAYCIYASAHVWVTEPEGQRVRGEGWVAASHLCRTPGTLRYHRGMKMRHAIGEVLGRMADITMTPLHRPDPH